ncbi:MAG: hypothetical protein OEN56_03000 [Gemmatimonadota bacterium]|nr:hypothetical protein [Gemmatimonadota bacterium]
MIHRHDDDDLRSDLTALRDDVRTSGRVPDFDAMLRRAKVEAAAGRAEGERVLRPRKAWAIRSRAWVPLAAAAAAVGLFLVGGPRTDADAEFERLVADYARTAATTLRSPTASLMEIPGVDLGAVPSIGGSLPGLTFPETGTPEGRDS